MKVAADDLFGTPLDQSEIDFENEGGETYICGNPPYKGGTEQNAEQKQDMEALFATQTDSWKSLDYVSGWFMQFARYAKATKASCAFVSTNSITQGEQVARLWPLVLGSKLRINFAFTSFKWANLASHNAGVTVVIIGLAYKSASKTALYEDAGNEGIKRRDVENINAYLVPYRDLVVAARSDVLSGLPDMTNGNKPADGGHLILSLDEARQMVQQDLRVAPFIRPFIGAQDSIQGSLRSCLWIGDAQAIEAMAIPAIKARTDGVAQMRCGSKRL